MRIRAGYEIAHGLENVCFPGDFPQTDAKLLGAFEAADRVQLLIIPRGACREHSRIGR